MVSWLHVVAVLLTLLWTNDAQVADWKTYCEGSVCNGVWNNSTASCFAHQSGGGIYNSWTFGQTKCDPKALYGACGYSANYMAFGRLAIIPDLKTWNVVKAYLASVSPSLPSVTGLCQSNLQDLSNPTPYPRVCQWADGYTSTDYSVSMATLATWAPTNISCHVADQQCAKLVRTSTTTSGSRIVPQLANNCCSLATSATCGAPNYFDGTTSSCYVLVQTLLSWDTARAYCYTTAVGTLVQGKLATFLNITTYLNYVNGSGIVNSVPPGAHSVWIGLCTDKKYDQSVHKDLQWIDVPTTGNVQTINFWDVTQMTSIYYANGNLGNDTLMSCFAIGLGQNSLIPVSPAAHQIDYLCEMRPNFTITTTTTTTTSTSTSTTTPTTTTTTSSTTSSRTSSTTSSSTSASSSSSSSTPSTTTSTSSSTNSSTPSSSNSISTSSSGSTSSGSIISNTTISAVVSSTVSSIAASGVAGCQCLNGGQCVNNKTNSCACKGSWEGQICDQYGYPKDAVGITSFVAQSIGCTIVIVLLSITLGAYVVVRDTSAQSVLVFTSDIFCLITHILIATCRSPFVTNLSDLSCKIVSLFVQFSFETHLSCLFFQSLHAYALTTGVCTNGWWPFPSFLTITVAISIPAIITGVNGAFYFSELSQKWSCLINYNSNLSRSFLLLSFGILVVILIISESAAMHSRKLKLLLKTNRKSWLSAQLGVRSTAIVSSISFATVFSISLAVQLTSAPPMFTVGFASNITFAIIIFMFHSLENPKIRTVLRTVWRRFTCKS